MNVAILLITHDKIATSMMETVSSIVNDKPDNFACVEIPMDAPVEKMEKEIINELDHLKKQDGVLILTDIYGGTPSNIANKFAEKDHISLVSGLNLPMLVRIMNYRTLPIDALIDKAVDGGHDGIVAYKCEAV